MERFGYDNVITMSHNRMSPYQWKLLKGKELVFIFDNDRGGVAGLKYFYDTYSKDFDLYILDDEKYKDLDEFSIGDPDNFCSKIDKFIF